MHARDLREIIISQQDKYIILDTQGGHQDIIGLIVALKLAVKFNKIVLGITCIAGRRGMEDCVRDALLAQQIAGTTVPVYKGSTQSILLRRNYSKCINFTDQFQNLDSFKIQEKLHSLVQTQPATVFIYKSLKKYPSEVCFASFGPLTNLALAFHLSQCNNTQNQFSSIRINGGTANGIGNTIDSPSVEGNFGFDPQAAHIVLSNLKNIFVNPIQKTLQTSLKEQFESILNSKNKEENLCKSRFLIDHLLKKQYCTCGPLLTVLPIFDKLVSDRVLNVYSQVMHLKSSINGLMAPNWMRLEVGQNQQIPNTKIYSSVDKIIIKKLLDKAFH